MQIAVVGIVVFNDECLFLKRNNPPHNWCPPCGRVEKEETFIFALQREIKEETALDVKIIDLPVEVWEGTHDDKKTISITYVCQAQSKKAGLSHEHSHFCWIKISDLIKSTINTNFTTEKWPLWIETANFYFSRK